MASSERTVENARPVRSHGGLATRLAASPALVWSSILAASALVFGLMAEDFAAAMVDLPGTVEAAERIGWMLEAPEGVAALFARLPHAGPGALRRRTVGRDPRGGSVVADRAHPGAARESYGVAGHTCRGDGPGGGRLAFVTALATWIGAAVTGNAPAFADLPLAAFNLVPVTWMFLGIGIALVGLAPRRTAAFAFGLVIAAYLLDRVGGFMDLPERVLEISPFRHITAVPATDFAVRPALVMLAVGGIAAWVGIVAFRRRDLREA